MTHWFWDRVTCRWEVWRGTLRAYRALPHIAAVAGTCLSVTGATLPAHPTERATRKPSHAQSKSTHAPVASSVAAYTPYLPAQIVTQTIILPPTSTPLPSPPPPHAVPEPSSIALLFGAIFMLSICRRKQR